MTAAPPAAPAAAPAVSHTVRGAFRRGRTWIILGVAAVVAALVIAFVQGGVRGPGAALAADNPAPGGAMALAQVLEAQGVDVRTAGDLDAAIGLAGDDATVFLSDPEGYLDDDALERLAASTPALVVAGAHATALQALAPGVHHAGAADGAPAGPGCPAPVARGIERLGTGLPTFTVGDGATGWTGCFPDAAGRFALATDGAVSFAPGPLFANEHVAEAGNAALAVRLLGGHDRVVWYLPSLADVAGAAPSLGEITPRWVSPVLVLLVVATVWAAVWRGRRFGPLVAERLPVVVPAAETGEGRARLYERSGSRERALDQLRMGAVQRLATALGLGRAAGLDDVCGAAAAAAGRPLAAVRALLVDEQPAHDGEFVRLARELAAFEAAVQAAVRPAGRAAASTHGNGRPQASAPEPDIPTEPRQEPR